MTRKILYLLPVIIVFVLWARWNGVIPGFPSCDGAELKTHPGVASRHSTSYLAVITAMVKVLFLTSILSKQSPIETLGITYRFYSLWMSTRNNDIRCFAIQCWTKLLTTSNDTGNNMIDRWNKITTTGPASESCNVFFNVFGCLCQSSKSWIRIVLCRYVLYSIESDTFNLLARELGMITLLVMQRYWIGPLTMANAKVELFNEH
ncbi:hypothetical protein F5887DRAFT_1072652 [Amanita rubescens]|nr:hypothetical protein F5887DRAFT_1072652 [Amanita rubescens]